MRRDELINRFGGQVGRLLRLADTLAVIDRVLINDLASWSSQLQLALDVISTLPTGSSQYLI